MLRDEKKALPGMEPQPQTQAPGPGKAPEAPPRMRPDENPEPAFVIKPPPPDAPPEVHQAFEAAVVQALGVPESPDGYELSLQREAPIDQEVVAWFRTAAHQAGLSPQQARIIAEAYAELEESMSRRMSQAREQGRRQAVERLRGVWGENTGSNLETAMRGLRTLADASGADLARLEQVLDDSGLGDDPDFVRVFHHIGQSLAEDRLVDGRLGGARRRSAAEVLYGG